MDSADPNVMTPAVPSLSPTPEEQRVGDSRGIRCERAPATGCKPSPSQPQPRLPSHLPSPKLTFLLCKTAGHMDGARRTKTSEVRWAGQSGWAGHPGGRGFPPTTFPSPGVKVRVERATPNTRPALGESGHPARPGSPRGGSTQPPPSGRLEAPRGPGDGVARVPLTPSFLPSFIHFPFIESFHHPRPGQ